MAELRTLIAQLLWHFDLAAAPGGRDVEWLSQKCYAMVEKQRFDVELVCVRDD
jgi:hypothetical protein